MSLLSRLTRSHAEQTRVCSRTGLTLRRSSSQTVCRIAKTSFGPMNPPRRPLAGARAEWGRYDVAGHRTVYGAEPAEACYAESLASQRVALSLRNTTVGELFDNEAGGEASTLLEAVASEWEERSHMTPGKVAAGWRRERLLYQLQLPPRGWFIDIETAESIAAISGAIGYELASFGLEQVTVGTLRGEDREVTTRIAEWVRAQVLDDGSLPHGIVFGSKHGSPWTCWAIWLRALDDDKPLSSEPTRADDGCEIKAPEHNAALEYVAGLFDLRVF